MFVAGKLRGFRRIRNDRLLMFCLRMNARDERGRRLSASYFERSMSPSPPLGGEGLGRGGASLTMPALSRAEKDDMNAAIIEHFDPVRMTLAEIEAMQTMLSQAAARRRAEEEGPLEANLGPDFITLREGQWKDAGELESLAEVADELEEFNPGEDHWRDLDEA